MVTLPWCRDLPDLVLSGQFDAIGVSDTIIVTDTNMNISIWGGAGTVQVQRKFADDDEWKMVMETSDGCEGLGMEIERAVQYRFECTVFSSTIKYRLGLLSYRSANVR